MGDVVPAGGQRPARSRVPSPPGGPGTPIFHALVGEFEGDGKGDLFVPVDVSYQPLYPGGVPGFADFEGERPAVGPEPPGKGEHPPEREREGGARVSAGAPAAGGQSTAGARELPRKPRKPRRPNPPKPGPSSPGGSAA